MTEKRLRKCETARKKANSPATFIPIELRSRKRWMVAQERSRNGSIQRINVMLENVYCNILARTKRLWSGSKQLAFERDFRRDNTQSALAMYAFMTDSFYLYLQCDFDYVYTIEYAFDKCSIERELLELITPFVADYRVNKVILQPNFASFFTNVLAYQDKRFQYHL